MDPNNIFDIFFSVQNPAIMIIIIFTAISIIIILIKRDFITPLQRKKEKLENENLKLMALFAELDPDPILRIDDNGIIIKMNKPAENIFSVDKINKRCDSLIPNYNELKENSSDNNQVALVNGRHFTVSIKKSGQLKFSQIYLHDISNRIEQERLIKEYQKKLKLLRIKLDASNEMEREQLGRELHDHIGNRISVFKLSLQNYLENPEEEDLNLLYKKIDYLSEEVRGISRQLSPKILKEFGLISALTQLVDEMTTNSNMRGYIRNINYEDVDDFNLKLGIYRICQEALNNIVKHSNCNEFQIQIVIEDGFLKVIISDDGVGFSIEELERRNKPSLGLFNMKERTESLNGKFEFDSVKDEGTTIYLDFFLEKDET